MIGAPLGLEVGAEALAMGRGAAALAGAGLAAPRPNRLPDVPPDALPDAFPETPPGAPPAVLPDGFDEALPDVLPDELPDDCPVLPVLVLAVTPCAPGALFTALPVPSVLTRAPEAVAALVLPCAGAVPACAPA